MVRFIPSEALVAIVKDFKKRRPYTGSREQQLEKFEDFIKTLSSLYCLDPPSLYVTDANEPMTRFDIFLYEHLGCYQNDSKRICMRKFSVLTTLHEFRHFLQFRWRKWLDKRLSDDVEKDATKWSEALFNMVFKNDEPLR